MLKTRNTLIFYTSNIIQSCVTKIVKLHAGQIKSDGGPLFAHIYIMILIFLGILKYLDGGALVPVEVLTDNVHHKPIY
jgi:K+-transporting ATPase A subunit